MKKGNKLKLGFIKLIADNKVILHDFEIVKHMEPILTSEGYLRRTPNGRSTITLQIENIKEDD